MTVFDIETDPKGNIVIIGMIKDGHYKYFDSADKFYHWLKLKKIKEIWAHNLEFDFFKLAEYLPKIKFSAYFSTDRISYVQNGNIFFKDLYNHLAYGLPYIGKLLNLPKLKIDYKKIKKITRKLIEYNKRDCEITYRALKEIQKIYKAEGQKKIKSTIGSQALHIFLDRFYDGKFSTLDHYDLAVWRDGYRGGWCEAFYTDKHWGKFYKIDVNSLYPFIMLTGLPDPSDYNLQSYYPSSDIVYWLGKQYSFADYVYNNIEDGYEKNILYYTFPKICYPFKSYVRYFYDKKQKAKGLKKKIYKKLLNSLYGKFAQRFETDIISNYNFSPDNKNIFFKAEYTEDLYRIKFESKGKYWVNVLWSLFITAKAREYMRRMKRYIERKGLTVYYTDTDSFIISGDIEKIKPIISDTRMGLFKIEDVANEIDIRGKKMYKFGSLYKCKGLPKKYRKEFFEKGYVEYEKMVRYKESITRGLRLGTMVEAKKEDIKNRR